MLDPALGRRAAPGRSAPAPHATSCGPCGLPGERATFGECTGADAVGARPLLAPRALAAGGGAGDCHGCRVLEGSAAEARLRDQLLISQRRAEGPEAWRCGGAPKEPALEQVDELATRLRLPVPLFRAVRNPSGPRLLEPMLQMRLYSSLESVPSAQESRPVPGESA
mmetsp:Transcript_53647/g.160155  ORF Transcript_53647/g.160155 Transcript_53647/m.160155 type:complete len:167 (+) Transcript_53647:596-1096(+)